MNAAETHKFITSGQETRQCKNPYIFLGTSCEATGTDLTKQKVYFFIFHKVDKNSDFQRKNPTQNCSLLVTDFKLLAFKKMPFDRFPYPEIYDFLW